MHPFRLITPSISDSNNKYSDMKISSLLLLLTLPCIAFSQLTGYWQTDVGGCYQIRQNGNEVWWAAEAGGSMRAQNVFYGTITGTNLNGLWVDLPSNPMQGWGQTLNLRLETTTRMIKLNESAPYGGSIWSKLNGPCGSGTVISEFYPDIAGTWYKDGYQSIPCTIVQNGQSLTLSIDNNTSQGSFTSQSQIYANTWNAYATLSSDYQTITWGDQTWTRQATIIASNYPNIGGTWYKNGSSAEPCTITQNGQNLTLQTGTFTSSGQFTSQNQVFATEWNTTGSLSSDNQTITWGNQTWTRAAGTNGGGPGSGTLIEELTVPGTTKNKTWTTNTLLRGVKYELTISGTWSVWSTSEPTGVDALYAYRGGTPQLWSSLQINDQPLKTHMNKAVPPVKVEYHSDHIYRVTIEGTGKRMSFFLGDQDYHDNCGSVKVQIRQK